MQKRRGPLARLIRRVRRFLLFAVLLFVVLSAGLVFALRWLEPGFSAVMLQRQLAGEGDQSHVWVDIGDVSPHMSLAVVAAEDQRFPEHWGFDTGQILAAFEHHLEGGRLRGASTITQQVARNLFLWQGRSYVRKGLEAWFTLLIEALWTKRRTLEMYLNYAETGPRMFGVGVASREYFGRAPGDLNARQSALLAAALPNPVTYRVAAPSDYLQGRQRWILRQMRNLGGVSYLDGVLAEPAGH